MIADRLEVWDEELTTTVSLIRACKSLGALPRPGGLLDQDSFFIHMVSVYDEAMEERVERDKLRANNMAKMKSKT